MDCLSSAYRGLPLFCFAHLCAPHSAGGPVAGGRKMGSLHFGTVFPAGIRRSRSADLWCPCTSCVNANFVDSERWHTWALRTGVPNTARRPALVGARPLEDELRRETSKTIIDRRGGVGWLLSR